MSRRPLAWGHVAQCLRAVTRPPPLCSSASLFLAGPVHSPGPQQGTFLQARDLGAAPANRVSFRGKHTCAQDITEHGPRTPAAGGPRGGVCFQEPGRAARPAQRTPWNPGARAPAWADEKLADLDGGGDCTRLRSAQCQQAAHSQRLRWQHFLNTKMGNQIACQPVGTSS